ncbi:hypothetical protein MCOR07_003290 [Pyricularia oryzae]|uniref:Uncharacterized protein n=2 Tax=Pyricularia TaxID=48558 RepID=A0ABQ8P0G7_PYRGI|nr:hypothetical protein MCOR01_007660 [Pyricularia oryzae]KAI6304546.1 hypothetical protein MCOR33_000403 [Pyricularia grisea]KAI6262544.1 hypothetical protein MCOR19_001245 [Pyricularia oryzae]KAI6286818.1 hypothetical protein MCOR26_000796 [Pyricularia oryzae]KAI6315952.1 hypothetical protein MCOR34_004485 [Pyricularia oryzae]
MTRLFPRIHAFEIDDQPWFPPFLRQRVQTVLRLTWEASIPILQSSSPAERVARLLGEHLDSIDDYGFIDFCAGAGGPTPAIERHVNANRDPTKPGIPFIMTDIYPHVKSWERDAARSPNISYVTKPVDATAAPDFLLDRFRGSKDSSSSTGGDGIVSYAEMATMKETDHVIKPRKIFRLFNLAFHHFDDPLAKSILADTVKTSDAFGIFELQQRTFSSFMMLNILYLSIFVVAPFYALMNLDLVAFVFTWFLPIIPVVVTFDGYISSLRTRTPDEVEALLRTCGAGNVEDWEIRGGTERHFWPFGYLEWIICTKKSSAS